jgi:hypothetical protein
MSRTGHRTYRRRRARVLKTSDVCSWCGRWLDPDLKWPHPYSATVDHIIPVSRPGGIEHQRRTRRVMLGMQPESCNAPDQIAH